MVGAEIAGTQYVPLAGLEKCHELDTDKHAVGS